jgi:hypothetical protein
MTPKDVLIAGIIRATVLAAIVTLATIGQGLVSDDTTRHIIGAALTGFSAYWIARFAEAGVDALRSFYGTVLVSDIGHASTTVTMPDSHTATVTVAPAAPPA